MLRNVTDSGKRTTTCDILEFVMFKLPEVVVAISIFLKSHMLNFNKKIVGVYLVWFLYILLKFCLQMFSSFRENSFQKCPRTFDPPYIRIVWNKY